MENTKLERYVNYSKDKKESLNELVRLSSELEFFFDFEKFNNYGTQEIDFTSGDDYSVLLVMHKDQETLEIFISEFLPTPLSHKISKKITVKDFLKKDHETLTKEINQFIETYEKSNDY